MMKEQFGVTHLFISIAIIYILLSSSNANGSFRIGAFNVQLFGAAKMRNEDNVNILTQIIQRYDVILIQEIRDASGEAIVSLLEKVNETDDHQYEMKLSDRLGQSKSKEQYAFFYRSDIGLEVSSTYQSPDQNKFQRPPFAILLSLPSQQLQKVALIAIHTSPNNALMEIDALVDVHDAVRRRWNTDNIVIMGDFNAAPPYLRDTRMRELKLRDTSKYCWLIPDTLDTTVASSVSAYDRIVVTGNELINSIDPGSAMTFRYDEYFGLDRNKVKAVSDHFPIEFSIITRNRKRLRSKRQTLGDGEPQLQCDPDSDSAIQTAPHQLIFMVVLVCMLNSFLL